jgi:hypothetical protein
MARPLKLNDEITNIICENIEMGLSYSLSAAGAQITFQTFNDWMKKAQEEGADEQYIEFATRVRAAETACAKDCLLRVREASKCGTWAASAWLLERRFKNDYGRQERIDMRAEHSGQVRIELRQEDCGSDD